MKNTEPKQEDALWWELADTLLGYIEETQLSEVMLAITPIIEKIASPTRWFAERGQV
jgi:hypothetical protein